MEISEKYSPFQAVKAKALYKKIKRCVSNDNEDDLESLLSQIPEAKYYTRSSKCKTFFNANRVVNGDTSMTLVQWACVKNSFKCLHWLLMHSASALISNSEGVSPMQTCVHSNHYNCLKCIMTHCSIAKPTDPIEMHPFVLACSSGHIECVKVFLKNNLDPNEFMFEDGSNLAHVTAGVGSLGVLQLISRLGVNIEKLDLNGDSPLHFAAREGHLDCVEFIVRSLPQKCTLLNSVNNYGETPETLASKYLRTDCMHYFALLNRKPVRVLNDLNMPDSVHDAARDGNLKELALLILNDENRMEERDITLSTCLHKAAGSGHADCVAWLLLHGANPLHQNADGETALEVAYRYGHGGCNNVLPTDNI